MLGLRKKNRASLGVIRQKRRYDLPLDKGSGGTFLKTLIALMTFLAIIGLAASYTLDEMTKRWSSGLENKASVEVPAQDREGRLIEQQRIENMTAQLVKMLNNHPAIDQVEVMPKDQLSNLVAPWLGDDLAFDSIPLPGIISVAFKPDIKFDMETLAGRIQELVPQARLDTHESWVNDVLRFTGALQFSALLITSIIGVTTIVAVAGAIQSRMAIYHEELELLHLMGAGDGYISRQLQRYSFLLAVQGALVGAILGGIMLILVRWSIGKMDISLLPDFSLNGSQIMTLGGIPLLIGILAMLTARQTVLRVLAKMP